MKIKVNETEKNALSVQCRALAQQATLPALSVPHQRSVLIEAIAPAFQAERLAEAEAEKRRKEKQAQRDEKRRLRRQRAGRQAIFAVD